MALTHMSNVRLNGTRAPRNEDIFTLYAISASLPMEAISMERVHGSTEIACNHEWAHG